MKRLTSLEKAKIVFGENKRIIDMGSYFLVSAAAENGKGSGMYTTPSKVRVNNLYNQKIAKLLKGE